MENNQRFALKDSEGKDIELDTLIESSEVQALPLGVDIILEDAGEQPETVMKNE